MQGSAFFLSGVFLVVIGWAVIGTILETYGFWLLFRGFFPAVLGFLRRLPMMGAVLDAPGLKSVSACIPARLSSYFWRGPVSVTPGHAMGIVWCACYLEWKLQQCHLLLDTADCLAHWAAVEAQRGLE